MLDSLLTLTLESLKLTFYIGHIVSAIVLVLSGVSLLEDCKNCYKYYQKSYKIYYLTGCILLCWVPILNTILCVSSFLYLNKITVEE